MEFIIFNKVSLCSLASNFMRFGGNASEKMFSFDGKDITEMLISLLLLSFLNFPHGCLFYKTYQLITFYISDLKT